MKLSSLSKLRCPKSKSLLSVKFIDKEGNGEVLEGILVNKAGYEYKIENGMFKMESFV